MVLDQALKLGNLGKVSQLLNSHHQDQLYCSDLNFSGPETL